MKAINMKPLVTISTYEERQAELNKINNKTDETDHSQNGILKTDNNEICQFPTPPPPPQFANCAGSQKFQTSSNISKLKSELLSSSSSSSLSLQAEIPTPDYDSTPTHTFTRNSNNNGSSNYNNNNNNTIKNGSIITTTSSKNCTIGRVAASEVAKANGDAAEMESIDSYKLQNPSLAIIPKPPALYFAPQNSGPPTMKKTINKHVAVTIGEYGGQNLRKEPAKLDFISKINENENNNNSNSIINKCQNNLQQQSSDNTIKCSGNGINNGFNGVNNAGSNNGGGIDNSSISDKLRNELQSTLSRSNLKKRNDNRINNDNIISTISNNTNTNTYYQNDTINTSNIKNSSSSSSSITPSAIKAGQLFSTNVEKLATMLQNKHNKTFDIINNTKIMDNNNHNKCATIKNANKVTISIPSTNKQELRMTESAPPLSSSNTTLTPTNGILKNCYTKSNNFGEKSITFGN